MKIIATHRRPDADAAVSAWLVRRHLFSDSPCAVRLLGLNTRIPDTVDAIVDVGRVYAPTQLRFDHSRPAISDPRSTSATRMVWEFLLAHRHPVGDLANLVDAVDDGDRPGRRGRSETYQESRLCGVHAEFNRIKRETDDGIAQVRYLFDWLDERYGVAEMAELSLDAPATRYGRGKVYLHTLDAKCRNHRPAVNPRRDPPAMPALSKWDRGWRIADELAEFFQLSASQIRGDAKFAFALDTVASGVDQRVRQEMMSEYLSPTDEDLAFVASRSPARQRYAITQARLGRSVRRSDTAVYDTTHFGKITSRICRARGAIEARLAGLDQLNGQEVVALPEISIEVEATYSQLCRVYPSQNFDDWRDIPQCYTTGRRKVSSNRHLLPAACGLLRKCARDIPRMSEQLLPTKAEVWDCLNHLRKIKTAITGMQADDSEDADE